MPNKRGKHLMLIILITIVILLLGVSSALVYNLINETNNENTKKSINNPIEDKTIEEAIENFNETYINYLLIEMDADELKRTPVSREKPIIDMEIEDEKYHAIIDRREIEVEEGSNEKSDIKIITTREEIVKIMFDEEYLVESFSSGNSQIELLSSERTLFLKGYLKIYNKFN